MTHDKMIYMANQIATFFDSQPGNHKAADIAKHLRAFWDPRMLTQIYAHVDTGGAGLKPHVIEAVVQMRQPKAA
jgi:formate dehydrogenase subunit delta